MSSVHHITTSSDLETNYKNYISTINQLPNSTLNPYLSQQINHNDKILSPEQYHGLILPGSNFEIVDIIANVEKRTVSSRLDITLKDGKKVKEHVWYRYNGDWKIDRVWSMVEFL